MGRQPDGPGPGLNKISYEIIGAAIRVHRGLGPGLLESAYRESLAYVLSEEGLSVAEEVAVPARFEGLDLDAYYRIDMIVEASVVLELKAREEILPVHRSQLRTYLEITDTTLGLLLNFNVPQMIDGVHRIIV